jgi:predicted phosphoribosyltransferase
VKVPSVNDAVTVTAPEVRALTTPVAAPTVAADLAADVARGADEFAAVVTPTDFRSVGEWYEDFRQTTDDDVRRILAASGTTAARRDASGPTRPR